MNSSVLPEFQEITRKFTVIIPNTDSPLMDNIIQALYKQTVNINEGEVLVVGSDRKGLVIESDLVRLIDTSGRASCASDKRNIGMQAAQGSIFFFLDDDCIPNPKWLECHLNRHQQGEMVVGGAVDFCKQNYAQLADNVSAFHDLLIWSPSGYRPYLATANLSVSRSVATRAGLMEPHQNRAEDLEWTVRFRKLGYRLFFDPGAVVVHDPRRLNILSVWRHWTGDAENTIRVRLKYANLLNTPALAKYRLVYFWGSPLVAAWATRRTFSHKRTFIEFGYTLPLVYLTKIAWCWGAFKHFPKSE